jgi:hypothetical protein
MSRSVFGLGCRPIGMCAIGDYLAIVGMPPVAGAYASAMAAFVQAARGAPIQTVMDDALRAGVFGSLACVPASGLGLLAALALC